MTAVLVGKDRTEALRLKDLLGRSRVANMVAEQHPLGAGFRALDRWLAGADLTPSEKTASADLELIARELFRSEQNWLPHRQRLVKDLLKASECQAIVFELRVSMYALRPRLNQVTWTRYTPKCGDFSTTGPSLTVECKLITTGPPERDTLGWVKNQVFGRASKSTQQLEPSDHPYVIAVGFDEEIDIDLIEGVTNIVREKANWFGDHPEASALLIFTPQRANAGQVEAFGLRGRPFGFGTVTHVMNGRATYGLPANFAFANQGPIAWKILRKSGVT
jgi:hypothetical protein